jgi:phytanoyl-CoA hydroxylase
MSYIGPSESTKARGRSISIGASAPRSPAGSHREPELRPHLPLHQDRGQSHTLVATVDESSETLDVAELHRGDVTVHHERAIHGSGGNASERWRRGYVVAFRSRGTVAAERALGFTHSHNDDVRVLNWIARQTA